MELFGLHVIFLLEVALLLSVRSKIKSVKLC